MNIDWDKLFSYWIFSWFIIYYFGNIYLEKYSGFRVSSPKLALYIAFFFNLIELFSFITVNLNWWLVLKYILMILFVKVLPIYLLRNDNIRIKDFYILIGVLLGYIIYLHMRGTSLFEVYKQVNKSLAEGKNDTPFFRFLNWISENR